MTHAIDVLVPAYNAEKTIADAVLSMQRQTLADIRIHVVNDGSTDATGAILQELARSDLRIVIHTKANGGIVDALNLGLAHCTAEFVARHDADDLADPTRLEVQIAYLRGHPDTVAVGSAVRHVDGEGKNLGTVGRIGSTEHADPRSIPAREPYLIHPFLMVRREAIVRVGGYRHVHHAEDADLYWRLREVGKLHNLDAVLGSYRIHDQSISGASIVNGRIQAVCSQLAALSQQRRERGAADLAFDKASLAQLKAAGSIEAMVGLAGASLDPQERRWFEEAVSAKLLELAAYRPYELEARDCVFIGQVAARGVGHLPSANRADQIKRLSGSAARLAAKGRIADAFSMLMPAAYPAFGLRLAARMAMPGRLRQALRRDPGAAPVK